MQIVRMDRNTLIVLKHPFSPNPSALLVCGHKKKVPATGSKSSAETIVSFPVASDLFIPYGEPLNCLLAIPQAERTWSAETAPG